MHTLQVLLHSFVLPTYGHLLDNNWVKRKVHKKYNNDSLNRLWPVIIVFFVYVALDLLVVKQVCIRCPGLHIVLQLQV